MENKLALLAGNCTLWSKMLLVLLGFVNPMHLLCRETVLKIRLDLVWFLLKKIIKLNYFFKKIKIGLNRPVSILFFRTKTGSNWFGSVFFLFGSGFFQVFFGLSSVRFGFFGFRLIKPNRTG
jgi:hypothetical protein